MGGGWEGEGGEGGGCAAGAGAGAVTVEEGPEVADLERSAWRRARNSRPLMVGTLLRPLGIELFIIVHLERVNELARTIKCSHQANEQK